MARILVVDDQADLRGFLERAAQKYAEEVFTAQHGNEAIELIQKHDFDLIITDLSIETDTAGLDVLNAAKDKNTHIQVIVVTAYGKPEISVEAMRLGAFDYLERNDPSINHPYMLKKKIQLALEFRHNLLTHEQ